jgi:hypothetical protein
MIEKTMVATMENLGEKRVHFALSGQPVVLFSPKRRKSPHRSEQTPPFEPYEENLPLQSGYYTFVIDQKGRFRVKWGNTSSHAAMVGYQKAAAAGHFRISRIGKLAEVRITSYDYGILCPSPNDRVLVYAIESFLGHPAFDASEHVIFHFSAKRYESSTVGRRGELLNAADIAFKLELLENEGLEHGASNELDAGQVERFRGYQPTAPPSLHAMHRDQLVINIEEGDSIDDFRPGPAHSVFSPESPGLYVGKNNFVIDNTGWLIVGATGHHILSGGNEVGGAGHLIVQGSGRIGAVHLNFSGHYRPPLTFEYVRYVYRALLCHPLLSFAEECEILGRKFDEETDRTSVIKFTAAELLADNPEGEEALERVLL